MRRASGPRDGDDAHDGVSDARGREVHGADIRDCEAAQGLDANASGSVDLALSCDLTVY